VSEGRGSRTAQKRRLELLVPISLLASFVATSILVDRNCLAPLDEAVGLWVERHITPYRTAVMFAWTDLAATWFVLAVTTFTGVFLALTGWGYWTKRLAWTVVGCTLSIEIVKRVFQRGRPTAPHPLLELATYSFPSGHTASATALYSFLAILICSFIPSRVWRVLVWTAAVCIIGGVAFSRVYLGAHYLSDVAGGLIMGLVWLSLAPQFVRKGAREG